MATLTATVLPALSGVRLDLDWSDTPAVLLAQIWRAAGGVEVLVRTTGLADIGGEPAHELSGGRAVVYDLEAPLDVPVSYRAVADTGAALAAAGTYTVASDGHPRLKDPLRPGRNIVLLLSPDLDCPPDAGGVVFVAMAGERYAGAGARFDAADGEYPIPVTGRRKAPTSALTLVGLTFADRHALLELLAPGSPLLFQAPPAYGISDRYMDVGDVAVDRLVADHRVPYRVVDLPHAAVAAPPGPAEGVPGTRWSDLCNVHATWVALDAANLTGVQVLQGAAG